MISFRRASDYLSKLLEQQSENGLALAAVPTQALGVVVEDGAGGATLEAAARLMVEFVGGEFHRQDEVRGRVRSAGVAQEEARLRRRSRRRRSADRSASSSASHSGGRSSSFTVPSMIGSPY